MHSTMHNHAQHVNSTTYHKSQYTLHYDHGDCQSGEVQSPVEKVTRRNARLYINVPGTVAPTPLPSRRGTSPHASKPSHTLYGSRWRDCADAESAPSGCGMRISQVNVGPICETPAHRRSLDAAIRLSELLAAG